MLPFPVLANANAVRRRPAADFSAAPTAGLDPLNVHFTDLSAGAVTGWLWDFGDGATGATQNPVHQYTTGTYTVTLTVTGPGGSGQKVRANYITVG